MWILPFPMPEERVSLASLGLNHWKQGWGVPTLDRSVEKRPLRIGGVTYPTGIGSHAPGGATYELDGKVIRIEGSVGVSDSASGTVEFSLWGDGKRLWRSGNVEHGKPVVPFQVPLLGVRRVTLIMSDGGNGAGGDHANWLDVNFVISGKAPLPTRFMKPLTPLLDHPRQTIHNFAASDSWTVEPLFKWPEAKRKEVAKLLFDPKEGIGLSGWRFNLGGGLNHENITIPYRTVDTFDAGEGKFDFSRVPGQRWMLDAAKSYGVPNLIAYSVTAPRRLTRNGNTNGTDGQGSTNLGEGQEPAFARYLAGILEHFRNKGYPFNTLSPINEPDFEWNGAPNPGSQEGSRASNADIVKQTQAISDEFKRRGLPVRILTPEASSPQVGYETTESMTKKYGAKYGAYADMFAEAETWRNNVKPIYGYHSYWSDSLEQMVSIRKRLKEKLNHSPGLEIWQTEYCQMAGPRGEGGWGRDLGMTLALNTARLIVLDMNIVETSAWQWWLAISNGDYKDGLIYVDDLDQETGDVFASKTLWALGNFSRFVRPGFQRIEIEEPFDDISSVLASAFRDPKTGRVVIVTVNCDTNSEVLQLRLPGKWKSSAWITSDRPGHDLAPLKGPIATDHVTVPSRSVVTFVFDPQ